MYYQQLSTYVYLLPCGHEFRSLTPSVPVTGELNEPEAPAESYGAAHWFYCQACKRPCVVEPEALKELPPVSQRGKELKPGAQALAVDSAIKRDRIVAHYRAHWDALGVRDVAEQFGASSKTVCRIAAELGVYEY